MNTEYCADIAPLINQYFHVQPISIKHIGGGFYGKVYLIQIEKPPYKLVVKIYNKKGLNKREQAQLTILADHAKIRMPKVHCVHDSNDLIPMDALIMEYLEGMNAGNVSGLKPENIRSIADQIVDNLISYHSVINPAGFGELDSPNFVKNWNDYYRAKVDIIYQDAARMLAENRLGHDIFKVVNLAYENYDKIFCEPVEKACLIHGDYNTWNVMLDEELTCAVAVIDPFNCCWGDPELDLYQLDNANGKYFGLMENYQSKVPVSKNFAIKNCFYELFTEIKHYYDADVDVVKSNIAEEAIKLQEQMQKIGICSKWALLH